MTNLERRLIELEAKRNKSDLTPEQSKRLIGDFYARLGITREQVVSEYGSEANFAYHWMLEGQKESRQQPNDGLSARDRYMRMIGK